MSFSAVLETAIGLIFIFLLLGLIATAAQEAFAALTKLRGKYLLEGLSRMLADSVDDVWKAKWHYFSKALASIRGTTAYNERYAKKLKRGTAPTKPGSVLFDLIAAHPMISDPGSKTVPSYATASSFFSALTDILRNPQSILEQLRNPRPVLDQIAGAIAGLPAAEPERAELTILIQEKAAFPALPADKRTKLIDDLTSHSTAIVGDQKTKADDKTKLLKLLGEVPTFGSKLASKINQLVTALPDADPGKAKLVALLKTPHTGGSEDPLSVDLFKEMKTAAGTIGDAATKTTVLESIANTPSASARSVTTDAAVLMAEVAGGIGRLPEGNVKRALKALLAESEGKFEDFKTKIEAWFNTSQERITGIYKRFTQYFALLLGIGIAAFLNVNAIHVADYLWTHEDARAALVDAAEIFATKAAEAPAADGELDALRAEVAAAETAVQEAIAAAAVPGAPPEAVAAAEARLTEAEQALAAAENPTVEVILDRFRTTTAELNRQLDELPLPIGRAERCGVTRLVWIFSIARPLTESECAATRALAAASAADRTAALAAENARIEALSAEQRTAECEKARAGEGAGTFPLQCIPEQARPEPPVALGSWLLTILGWLLTGLAVSLGAPFWFDLLKKFMNIRSAGAAPDEATPGKAGK